MHRTRRAPDLDQAPGSHSATRSGTGRREQRERRERQEQQERREQREGRVRRHRKQLVTGAFGICVASAVMAVMNQATHARTPITDPANTVTATVIALPNAGLQSLPVAPAPNLMDLQPTSRLAPPAFMSAVPNPAATDSAGGGTPSSTAPSRGGPLGSTGSRAGTVSGHVTSPNTPSYPSPSSGYASPFWRFPGAGPYYGSTRYGEAHYRSGPTYYAPTTSAHATSAPTSPSR